MTETSILLLKDLLAVLHTSRPTFYRVFLKDPTFPKPFKMSIARNAWLRADVEAWILARAAEANGGAA